MELGHADSQGSYWCWHGVDVGNEDTLALNVFPLSLLSRRYNDIVVLLELGTLLNVAGVARHGCGD